MACPICGSDKCVIAGVSYDDRYGYPGMFPRVQCRTCRHVHLSARFAHEELSRLYTEYYPKRIYSVVDHSPPHERGGLGAWLDGARASAFRWVPRNVRILDVGCGACETLGYHVARGCDAYGVEINENVQGIAERFQYKVHVGPLSTNRFQPDYFDYVTLNQVIEHVQDPIGVLREISRILKTNGRVIVSTPNAAGWGAFVFRKRWINWHAPYHMHFFSKESIKRASENVGMVLDEADTVTSSVWLHLQWIHLLTRPKEGSRSVYWNTEARWSTPLKIGIRMLELFHRAKINHLFTRIFDGIGVGDNWVFVLRKR